MELTDSDFENTLHDVDEIELTNDKSNVWGIEIKNTGIAKKA